MFSQPFFSSYNNWNLIKEWRKAKQCWILANTKVKYEPIVKSHFFNGLYAFTSQLNWQRFLNHPISYINSYFTNIKWWEIFLYINRFVCLFVRLLPMNFNMLTLMKLRMWTPLTSGYVLKVYAGKWCERRSVVESSTSSRRYRGHLTEMRTV